MGYATPFHYDLPFADPTSIDRVVKRGLGAVGDRIVFEQGLDEALFRSMNRLLRRSPASLLSWPATVSSRIKYEPDDAIKLEGDEYNAVVYGQHLAFGGRVKEFSIAGTFWRGDGYIFKGDDPKGVHFWYETFRHPILGRVGEDEELDLGNMLSLCEAFIRIEQVPEELYLFDKELIDHALQEIYDLRDQQKHGLKIEPFKLNDEFIDNLLSSTLLE